MPGTALLPPAVESPLSSPSVFRAPLLVGGALTRDVRRPGAYSSTPFAIESLLIAIDAPGEGLALTNPPQNAPAVSSPLHAASLPLAATASISLSRAPPPAATARGFFHCRLVKDSCTSSRKPETSGKGDLAPLTAVISPHAVAMPPFTAATVLPPAAAAPPGAAATPLATAVPPTTVTALPVASSLPVALAPPPAAESSSTIATSPLASSSTRWLASLCPPSFTTAPPRTTAAPSLAILWPPPATPTPAAIAPPAAASSSSAAAALAMPIAWRALPPVPATASHRRTRTRRRSRNTRWRPMLVGSGGIGSPSKSPLVRCRRMPSRKTEPRAFFRRATSFDAEAVVTSIVVVSPSSTGTTVVAAASAAADNSRAAAARSVGSALNLLVLEAQRCHLISILTLDSGSQPQPRPRTRPRI
eukprot:scaffold10717_cov61-Phaeocystis_antarctica.AAC.10